MAERLRVLFDLNVVLDVLQRREPFYASSARVLACAEAGLILGYLAAHSVTTLFCLVAKDHTTERARVTLTELLQVLRVAAVDQQTIEGALNLPYRDFEDAVQMMASVQIAAQYLVTRNVRDYKTGPVPALQPVELLSLL
jgi:hypothetical protein